MSNTGIAAARESDRPANIFIPTYFLYTIHLLPKKAAVIKKILEIDFTFAKGTVKLIIENGYDKLD